MASARNGEDVNEADEGWNGQRQQEDEGADVRKGPERMPGSVLFETLPGALLGAGTEVDEIPAPKERHRYFIISESPFDQPSQ